MLQFQEESGVVGGSAAREQPRMSLTLKAVVLTLALVAVTGE